jgi:nitrogenase iron protein NifH
LNEFAADLGTGIIGIVPRDDEIQRYEDENRTVVEGDPEAPISRVFLG